MSKIRVLLVDDSKHDRALVRHALEVESDKFYVIEAVNREQFERLLVEESFDVVLSDFNILGFEGAEVLTSVQARRPGVPVVIVTGTGSEETAVEMLRAGAADYVIKTPRHIARLPHTIQSVMDSKQRNDELLKSNQAIRQAEALFHDVFDSTADGILIVDIVTGLVTRMNSAMRRMLGSGQDVLQEAYLGEVTPEIEKIRITIAQGHEDSFDFPVRLDVALQRSDNTMVFADLSVERMSVGGAPALLCVYHDVTQTRNLKRALAHAERLSTVGTLAAGIAHEINNPLTYVQYYLMSLEAALPRKLGLNSATGAGAKRTAEQSDEDIMGWIERVREGVNRIQQVSKDLGAFSRADGGDVARIDPLVGVQQAIRMAEHEISRKAQLVVDLAPLPQVIADQGGIAQVVLNLLINASHAIGDGGTQHNQVKVRSWAESEHACVEVSDTGAGIPPSLLKHIFEPFFTTKSAGNGSGLGLSVSSEIVQQFGGSLTVSTKLGQGTKFVIRLPVAVDGATEFTHHRVSSGAMPAVDATRPLRVLIVETDAAIQAVLKRSLAPEHRSVVANSGREAVAVFERDMDFQVVVSALWMRQMTGLDLHAWLLERDPVLARRMLLITGGTIDPSTRTYLLEHGLQFLRKPFSMAQFRAKVERASRK